MIISSSVCLGAAGCSQCNRELSSYDGLLDSIATGQSQAAGGYCPLEGSILNMSNMLSDRQVFSLMTGHLERTHWSLQELNQTLFRSSGSDLINWEIIHLNVLSTQ